MFNKLINIVFKLISSLQSKPALFYNKTAKNSTFFTFYKDDIFEAFKFY